MNIIYKLTNINKKEGKRFYIGSKIECTVENYLGVQTILDRNNKPYLGSSTCLEMKQDLINGDIFEAEILEVVPKRNLVRERENFYLKSYNVLSDIFYNKTDNALAPRNSKEGQNVIINKYGETLKEYAASKSGISKRVNRCKKLGFSSYKDLVIYVNEKLNSGETLAKISRDLKCNRHSIGSTLKGVNLKKCVSEMKDTTIKKTVKLFFLHNASVHKTAEILNLELPTVVYFLQEYNPVRKKVDVLLNRKGISKIDITKIIIREYLEGKSIKKISENLKLDRRTTQKYFDYYVKKRLNINDI